MARTFGYPLFKTETLEDLSFEKYKVLIRLTEQMHKEMSDSLSDGASSDFSAPQPKKSKRKTIRITTDG